MMNLTNASRILRYSNVSFMRSDHPLVVDLYLYLEIIFFFLILLGNLLVIISFVKFPSIRKKLPHHWLLHLSLADLLLGLSLPFHVYTFLSTAQINCSPWLAYICLARYGSAQISLGTSLCVLVGLAIHVLLSLRSPYKYNRWISPKRVHLIATGIWIVNFACFALPFFGLNEFKIEVQNDGVVMAYCGLVQVWSQWYTEMMVWTMLILSVSLCAAYYLVFKVAWEKTHDHSVPAAFFNNGPKNSKVVQTFVLITVSTILCFVPFGVCTLLQKKLWVKYKTKDVDLEIASAVATLMIFFHSVLNPLIYSFRLTDFQKAFKAILSCRWESNLAINK